jgi:DNA polymerase (family X)
MPAKNDEVAQLLSELAALTEIEEGDPNSFRVRAYQNAARAVETMSQDVAGMSASQLASQRGIGKSTASKIRQFVDEGKIDKLEELRAKYPPGQRELLRIPGIGPKTLTLLKDVLGVEDLAGLRDAIQSGRLAELPGLGEKTAENLKDAIERMHLQSKTHRRPIREVLPVAERLVADLQALDAVKGVTYAGSLRRFRDTIGDVDLLVSTSDPAPAMDLLTAHDLTHDVIGRGPTKCSIVTHDGLQVDLRAIPPESFGAALLYFTGSKAHNIVLRQRAIEKGWKLSEYALEDAELGTRVAGRTEHEVYNALGLDWVTPELREDVGEIALADRSDKSTHLPEPVTVEHLRGDLHDHSDWSGDGRSSMEDMIAAAADRGYAYFALTDHAENLRINGIDRAGMLEQRKQLRKLQEQYPDMRLLHGSELNIGIDGTVDYDDEFLAKFDWCVASVHSHFRRPPAQQTARLVAAMRNPNVHAIGHLSGRKIGTRPGIEFDLDVVLDTAVETGTAIEINSDLNRLDATAEVVREGARRGVTFVISTDAHMVKELDNTRHGVKQARRGGLPPEQVANTWDVDRFLAWIVHQRSA